MKADQLREKLSDAGAARVRARIALHKADQEVVKLLRQVVEHPEVTMTEAGERIGERRDRCYHLITKANKNAGASAVSGSDGLGA